MKNVTCKLSAWGRIAACLVLLAGSAFAQYAPNGWVKPRAWNFLVPLDSPMQAPGCQGVPEAMFMRNFVAPHNIGLEDPKAGDVWGDIDFYGAAASYGHEVAPFFAAGLLAEGQWISIDAIEAALGAAIPFPFTEYDTVNYDSGDNANADSLITFLNKIVVPQICPWVDQVNWTEDWRIRWDNIMGIATTYVLNNTDAPLPVGVCTSSDDGIQVWVNDVVVENIIGCRGTDGDCSETSPAILPLGVSKITTLVFEGGGGFGFRLGLVNHTTGARYRDGDADVSFLGTGVGDEGITGTPTLSLVRSTSRDPLVCEVPQTVSYTLKGQNVTGTSTVTETIVHAPGADLAVTPANGGVVTDFNPVGVFADAAIVGNHQCLNWPLSGTTFDEATEEYTSISYTGNDIWDGGDGFEFAYAKVTGDFDVSMKMLPYTRVENTNGDDHRWGKYGIMARASLATCARYTIIQDSGPDRQDPIRQAGRRNYGDCTNMYEDGGFAVGVAAHPTYFRLTRDGAIFTGWVSDDPAVETDPYNEALWVKCNTNDDWSDGGVNTAPDAVYLGFANSDHGSNRCNGNLVRFKIIGLDAEPVALDTPIAKTITWASKPAADIGAGVGYTLATGSSVSVTMGAKINGGEGISSAPGRADTLAPIANTGPIGIFENSREIGTGQGGFVGVTTYDDAGTYTLTNSGGDIWDGGDDFQFAYKKVTGDFVAIAHIPYRGMIDGSGPLPNGNSWGRHGIQARWSCDRNSAYTHTENLLPCVSEQNWPRVGYRQYHQINTYTQNWQAIDGFGQFPAEGQLPTWHKLIRRGDTLFGYMSEDDGAGAPKRWVYMGQNTAVNDTPDTLLVGIYLQGRLSTGGMAVFDNVSIEPLDPLAKLEVCTTGDVVINEAFDAVDGSNPTTNAYVNNRRGGGYLAQIRNNRLRVADEATGGTANNVWFPVANAEALAQGFTAEFDAFMVKGGVVESANPADGFGFIATQVAAPGAASGIPCQAAEVFSGNTEFIGDFPDPSARDATYDGETGIYTSVTDNFGEIWDGRDNCVFQYEVLSGDFDIAVEITEASTTGTPGRWGRFGIMARRSLAPDARFTFSTAHGFGEPDPSRQMGRTVESGGGGMYDGYLYGLPSINLNAVPPQTQGTRFLRLVRKGNTFMGFGSMAPGLADGTLDPTNDANWIGGFWDNWGDTTAADVYVGFANADHNDGGDHVQTVKYRILSCNGGATAPHPSRWLGGDGGGGIAYSWGDQIWTLRNNPDLVSFQVEFDNWTDWSMWNSGGGTNEPMPYGGSWRFDGSYHIGLNTNASVSSVQQSAQLGHTYDLPAIYNGPGVHTKVQYKPEGFVDVWVSDAATPGVDEMLVLSYQVPMFTGPVVIGLAGATGGATTTFEFDNLVVKVNCCEAATDTVTAVAASTLVEIPYPWVGVSASTTLSATVGGIDPGATATTTWSKVSDTTGGATFDSTTGTLTATGEGVVVMSVVVTDGVCLGSAPSEVTVTFKNAPRPVNWVMGEVNGDTQVDISDPIYLLGNLFLGGAAPPCMAACNVNGDLQVDISDPIYMLGNLFLGGPPPIGGAPNNGCVKVDGCGTLDRCK